jgi:hypothetical protein
MVDLGVGLRQQATTRVIGEIRRKLKYQASIFSELGKGPGEFRQCGRRYTWMKKTVEEDTGALALTDAQGILLGQWMGRREAFGLIAGRCSAADIGILRRMKEEKLYATLDCTWDEFCTRHLHVARRTVDMEIAYLREFGPAFFTIRQLTHVSVKDYRSIAPYITEQGVHVNGTVVALLPENSEPLAAAVEVLLKGSANEECAAKPESFDTLLKRCQAAARALCSYQKRLDERQKAALTAEAIKIRAAAEALGKLR